MTKRKKPLRVAMVGYGFMGAAHSHAWGSAARFFDLPLEPEMAAIVGRNRERTEAAAHRLGWASVETDWRRVVDRDDIDLIDICSPGNTHAEIAIAALEAGKHVLCEKPLANSVPDARAMTEAAVKARAEGVRSMVGFSYRRVPAVGLARWLVERGRIGELRHVRAHYLQDWIADPEAPLSWRLQKDKAGSGALGDIGAHAIDLAHYLTGERIEELGGALTTFVAERPLASDHLGLSGTATSSERGPVTVDDAAAFLARLSGGAVGVFEATRFASGHKNGLRIELNGSKGSLIFDFADLNYLTYYDATEGSDTAGFHRIPASEPDHPYVAAWWPPGHWLGYEHTFTHEVVDLVSGIGEGTDPSPSFEDGLYVQHVLETVEDSASAHEWRSVPTESTKG